MGMFNSQKYLMSIDGEKYTFLQQDGYFSFKLEGTIRELGYLLFQSHLAAYADGYGYLVKNSVGPLMLADVPTESQATVMLDSFSYIEPPPPPEFWDALGEQVKRFMGLIIFS
jgi:hypothetical protein